MIRACLALMLATSLSAVELVDDERYRFLVERYEQSLAHWEGTPGALPLRVELASACFDARMYWRAVELLEAVVADYPSFAPAWSNLSVNYGKMGMYDQAIAAIDRRMRLDPDDVMHAKLVKASWLLGTGDRAGAQRLIEATPDPGGDRSAFYHSCLACFHADSGELERLQHHVDRVLALDPEGERTFFERDVVFDPYRDQAWFIERFGVTLAGGASAEAAP